jgi:cell division protein FtsN
VKTDDKNVKANDKTTVKAEDKTTKVEDKAPVKTDDKNVKANDKTTVKAEEKTVKANDKTTVNAEEKTTVSAAKVEYKVQIGAYKDPSKATLPDLKGIGVKEGLLNKENGLTYVYLKGFKTIDEAKTAVKKAEEKGIVKPFVVGFKDGKKVELKDLNK